MHSFASPEKIDKTDWLTSTATAPRIVSMEPTPFGPERKNTNTPSYLVVTAALEHVSWWSSVRELVDRLDRLQREDIVAADEGLARLKRVENWERFRAIVFHDDLRNDLRAVAASALVEIFYAEVPSPLPRTRFTNQLAHLLPEMPPLVRMGFAEGLAESQDFKRLQDLFGEDPDDRVRDLVQTLLDEQE